MEHQDKTAKQKSELQGRCVTEILEPLNHGSTAWALRRCASESPATCFVNRYTREV